MLSANNIKWLGHVNEKATLSVYYQQFLLSYYSSYTMKATNFMIVFTLAMLAGVVQAQSNSEPEFESEGDSSERKFDPGK
jgi:hypothetical protein